MGSTGQAGLGDAAAVDDGERSGARLATAVAVAADAWLSDPRDAGVYARLVEAVERWRAFSQPVLPGTEQVAVPWAGPVAAVERTAVRSGEPETGAAGTAEPDTGEPGVGEPDEPAGTGQGRPDSGPGRVTTAGALLGGDVAQVLDRLRRG